METIVVLSGSGLSAESGLPTFRDAAGLWRQHSWQELASPEGWRQRPEMVLEFYNERRAKAWARGSGPGRKRYRIDDAPIALGQICEEGTQLRPNIVWFGEETRFMSEAREVVSLADKLLVTGTSLTVYPAAGLVDLAHDDADCVLNALEIEEVPRGFRFLAGRATDIVPKLVAHWIAGVCS